MDPKISIVTCTKDREKFLEACIRSVETQTYSNYEHIFIDGCSTDNSMQVMQDYIKRNPSKDIKVFSYEPKGIANALNQSLKHINGDLVHFLHSDDFYWNETSLERAATYFIKNPEISWLIGNGVFVHDGKYLVLPLGKILKKHIKTLLTTYNWIPHENTFVRKSILEKYGPFEEKHKISVEYPMWLRAIKEIEPMIVDENFTVYTFHEDSVSSNPKNYPRNTYEIIRSWKEAKTLPFIGSYEESLIYKGLKDVLDSLYTSS